MTRSCTPIEDEALRHVDAVFVENNWMPNTSVDGAVTVSSLPRRGSTRTCSGPPGRARRTG